MSDVVGSTQGVDSEFNITNDQEPLEFGEIGSSEAKKLMRQLPDNSRLLDYVGREAEAFDESRMIPYKGQDWAYDFVTLREGEVFDAFSIVAPTLNLTFLKTVQKGIFMRRRVEESSVLKLVGGTTAGTVRVDASGVKGISSEDELSFMAADRVIDYFFSVASIEQPLHADA